MSYIVHKRMDWTGVLVTMRSKLKVDMLELYFPTAPLNTI